MDNKLIQNKQLFADAYLSHLKKKESEIDQLDSVWLTLLDWFKCADLSNKSAMKKSFIYPVLDTLRFFHDESEDFVRLYVEPKKDKVVGLCMIIEKDANLDSTIKGKHYSQRLISNLKDNKSNWGILTNGSYWRVYYSKGTTPFESYFEVNLEGTLQDGEIDAIYLFQKFFHVEAFILDENGCLLDRHLEESEETAKKIERHLTNKMEDILSKICHGFIKAEGKYSYSEEEKTVIFNNSIYLLYRLLFILYAESRRLLPLDKSGYKEKSLNTLVELSREYHLGKKGTREDRQIWNTLHEVFNWINEGNTQLDIPPYNGGLFDDEEKPYLENQYINDAYLSEVLYNLGYTDKDERINYNDLSVRHLGSLYEGILEYQLFIAMEDMVARKVNKVLKYIPVSRTGKLKKIDILVKEGEIYFSHTSEERRLTGSYYTPEPIVQNIIENAVGRILFEKYKTFWPEVEKDLESVKTAINIDERKRIQEYIDNKILNFVNNVILNIHICDPAMGSGHFLVNATNYITNFIVEILNKTQWVNEYIDSDPQLWRRRVVEQSIFGVDMNILATELSKLSLWLITALEDKPLSFLDHHLRTGHSLYGVNIEELGRLPSKNNKKKRMQTDWHQITFKEKLLPRLLELYRQIEDIPSDERKDIEEKKTKYKLWEQFKAGMQYIADAWLSTYFDVEISNIEYQDWFNNVLEEKSINKSESIEVIAKKNRFFHWQLEYPEIFFNDDKGFDIVIGNPPYGVKDDNPFLKTYDLESKDSYGLFVKRGVQLLRESGIFSMVISDTWRTIKSHWNLRRYILDHTKVCRLIKLNRHAFKGVDAFTIITELEKCSDKERRKSNYYYFFDFWQIHPEKQKQYFLKLMEATDFQRRDYEWTFDPRRAGKYKTEQGLLEIYSKTPIFDGSEVIYRLLDENAPTSMITINGKKYQAREIKMSMKKVRIIDFQKVAPARAGLGLGKTEYILKESDANGPYEIVNKTLVLDEKEIENLTKDERINGIDTKYKSKYLLPHDKGGESDIKSGRLSNYYQPTKYYINWSKKSVAKLREFSKLPQGSKGKAYFRNERFYFKKGITYSTAGLYAPTFRIGSKSVFGARGSTIFSECFSIEFLLGILCSKLLKYIMKGIINNSVASDPGTINQAPLIIPTDVEILQIKKLVSAIISKQKNDAAYEHQNHEQKEIDQIIYRIYGLSEKEIIEIENWYNRRYPKLVGTNDIDKSKHNESLQEAV